MVEAFEQRSPPDNKGLPEKEALMSAFEINKNIYTLKQACLLFPEDSIVRRTLEEKIAVLREKRAKREKPGLLISIFEKPKSKSPRLERNPNAELKERREVKWYLEKHSKRYLELLRSLNAQIGEAMLPSCRLAICIPAFQEGKNIYKMLEGYTQQEGISPSQFEIIVLENHMKNEEKDQTAAEIERFRKDHPEIKTRHVYAIFPERNAIMGYIRKLAFDLALLRSLERQSQAGGLILGSNDADSRGYRRETLRTILNEFGRDRKLDLIVGRDTYPKEVFKKFPVLHAVFLFDRILKIVREHKVKPRTIIAPWSSGRMSYFTAEIYAAIGGYDSRLKRGSDINLGRRVKEAREKPHEHIKRVNAAKLITDPRRALAKMVVGGHWAEEFIDVEWTRDPKVAGKSWQDFQAPEIERLNRARLEEEINAVIDKMVRMKIIPEERRKRARWLRRNKGYISRTARILGINLEIKGDRIKLKDISKLKERLNQSL